MYVLAHEREHYTQIYTHARARTPSFAYIGSSANMCTHIHARYMLHKRVGRPSRYLSASLHYRTRGSSRKERAREGDGGGWKPFSVPGITGPSAKNQCDHPSQPARISRLLILRWSPSHLPREYPEPPRSRYVHDVKKSSRNRAVYVPTNFHSDSANPIYIVDRPSGNNRWDNKAPSQIPTRPNQPRSIVVYRKKRRKNDRELCDVIPADMVLILIKTHFHLARHSRQLGCMWIGPAVITDISKVKKKTVCKE